MKKEERRDAPKIRFDGFNEAWEQRKLGAVTDITMGQSPYGENYTKNPKDHILVQGNADMVNGWVFPRVWTTQITKTAEKGDIILSVRAPVGDIGKTQYNVVLGRGVAGIKGNEFIFQALNKMKSNGFWIRYSTGSTFESINSNDLKEANISIPCLSEQTNIGNFFKQLDNTIALHQSKLDKLKLMKKSYLQVMFPQKEELEPILRFANFVSVWEQRKLGEISEKVIEKNKNIFYTETLTNSAEYGIINQRDFFDKDISNKKNLDGYYVVRPNDFVYNPRISNLAPVGPIKRNNLGRTGVMSPLYYVFRTYDVDKIYLEKYFSANGWHKFMKLNGDSGARSDRFAIKDSVFREMPIPFPSLEEQERIGFFLKKIDDTITLHQTKLEKLQSLKKAYLQKMFI